MKVRRYIAPDIRSALNQVREEQGPNALILSNRKVDGGVELITAEDLDKDLAKAASAEVSFDGLVTKTEVKEIPVSVENPIPPRNVAHPDPVQEKPAERVNRMIRELEREDESFSPRRGGISGGRMADREGPELLWTQEPLLDQMRSELKSLRGLVQQQMTGMAWGEMGNRRPFQASLMRKLAKLGLSPSVAKNIAAQVPELVGEAEAWQFALHILGQQIPIATDDILTQGGVVALVGPTGVGKTTLITKLAVRYALNYGNEGIALITTDNRRIGAFDQLRSFGSIVGLSVWTVSSADDLRQILDNLGDRGLVLIDTAGMSSRDQRLLEHLDLIRGCSPLLRTYVVMSAVTQLQGMAEIVAAYAPLEPAGCVFTKLDETSSLGPALSVAIEQQLPVAYTSSGQCIPEDMEEANANILIHLAVSIAKRGLKDDEDALTESLFEGGSDYATF
jgi:flagellar biosynthesis protein FlhF